MILQETIRSQRISIELHVNTLKKIEMNQSSFHQDNLHLILKFMLAHFVDP